VNRTAAINLAKRISQKYNLQMPRTIEHIVKEYATLEYIEFPKDARSIDGITLDLKILGKTPRVYINQNKPKSRILFTLAHELGHIIIPWHIGTIIDNVSHDIGENDTQYAKYEREADAFASELLLPEDWLLEQIIDINDIKKLEERISIIYKTTGLSHSAIGYKITDFLSPNFIFLVVKSNNIIQWFKSSPSTLYKPEYNIKGSEIFNTNLYKTYHHQMYEINVNGYSYYWFYVGLDIVVEYDKEDTRLDQEILKQIIIDLDLDPKLIRQINPALGHAKSRLKLEHNLNYQNLYEHCIYKVETNDKYSWICNHKDYKTFIHKRVIALLNKN